MTTASSRYGPTFRVIAPDNHVGLPVGTLLVEVRRYEGWDHHGCIPSIRTLIAELEVADGLRRGEHIEAVVEQGYEYDPPWSGLETWLEDARATPADEAAAPVLAPDPVGVRAQIS
jgi:hypothetical protein